METLKEKLEKLIGIAATASEACLIRDGLVSEEKVFGEHKMSVYPREDSEFGQEIKIRKRIYQESSSPESFIAVMKSLLDALDALEGFKLGHEHAPNLSHTRAMGDGYGWCDHCNTRVFWGPGEAERVIAQIEELMKGS